MALGIDNLEHGLANSEYFPGEEPDDYPSRFRNGYADLDVNSEEVQETFPMMSANGARVLGIDDETGTIEVGKVADLVVLEGDPEADGHIRETRIVFKGGVGWDAPKLIDSIRGIVGIR